MKHLYTYHVKNLESYFVRSYGRLAVREAGRQTGWDRPWKLKLEKLKLKLEIKNIENRIIN